MIYKVPTSRQLYFCANMDSPTGRRVHSYAEME